MKETDRLFSCEFCRVKSYLFPKGIFCYMFSSPFPKKKNLVFFPYWRFKGMLFSCVEDGIKHRFIDVSHQAVESRYFPVSVGLRSQALKLSFVTTETQGRFLKPTLSFKEVMRLFENRFGASLPKPIFQQAHIGETLSLIYSPFYVNEKIHDAVLNKPVSSVLPVDFNPGHLPGGRPDWNIQFLPTLCPGCGWDLHGEQDALVLNCKNCNSVWRPYGNGFRRLQFACLPKKEGSVIYLPFWRIKADISGISLGSYTDLLRIANLPKAVQKGWDNIPFRFWSLAFKVTPQVFIGLTRNITLCQPQEQLLTELPDDRLHPVTLPIEEAFDSLKINLASFIKPRKNFFPKLQDIKIKPESYLLVYIPFTENHHEFIQTDLHLTINKKQLILAANL